MTWTYLVSNAGTADLVDVTVDDDQGVTVFCNGATPPPEGDPPVTGQPFTLPVGTTVVCNAFGIAVAGQYENLATATGSQVDFPPIQDTDLSHYFGGPPENPAVDLEKSTNGQDADAAPGPTLVAGDPVSWTYRVTNTGDVGLTGLTVSDDQSGVVVTCPQTTLTQGETIVCTAQGTAVPGQYANVGSVTATSLGGMTVEDSDPSHYFGATCFTGPTATGAGPATLCFLEEGPGCVLSDVTYIPLEGDAQSPPAGSAPAGIAFPYGLFAFTVGECAPGFTADFTLTLPSAPPPGTVYWKFGPTPGDGTPHWYELPVSIAGNVVSFSITDGGLGDHDGAADGFIDDPGGPGAPQANVVEIPTLDPRALGLLGGLLALAALAVLRRRAG